MKARAEAEANTQLPMGQVLASSVSAVAPPLHMSSNMAALPEALPVEGTFDLHFGPASDAPASIKALYRDTLHDA